MADSKHADRSPRLQPPRPQRTIEIPPPPDLDQKARRPLWQQLLPMVTIAAYLAIALAGVGRNPLYMIPMGLAAVLSVVAGGYMERKSREAQVAAERQYAQRLIAMRKEMEEYHEQQREFFRHNHPDVKTVLDIHGEDHNSPSGTRLWERRRYDADFGQLRIGIGSMPSDVVYVVKSIKEGTQISRDAQRLAEDSLYVDDIPVPLTLHAKNSNEPPATPIDLPSHAVGMCLRSGFTSATVEHLYAQVHAMLTQYIAFHSPLDTQLCLVGVASAQPHWEIGGKVWLSELPHCPPQKDVSRKIFPICFEDANTDADKIRRREDRVSQFWRVLKDELEQRKQRLSDSSDQSQYDYRYPWLLVIVDLMTPAPPENSAEEWLAGSALQNITSQPAVSMILSEGDRLGASIVFLTPSRNKVPDGCTAILEIDQNEPPLFRFAEAGVNARRYLGHADQLRVKERDVEKRLLAFVKQVAQWDITQGRSGIPDSVTLLEVEAEGDPAHTRYIEDLRIAKRWGNSLLSQNADWLRAKIGVMAGGEIRQLHFFTDADGVHALVAGSTGSGKSELLLALVLSMAINYDPTIVNFVLVDFKGGTAFDPLKALPHVVDVVTNLNEAAVDRMFTAIDAELHRRERINKDHGVKHIVEYRKKNLHREYPETPYPHLFIIIDEFAEMLTGDKKDEYRARLNSITRLGRALGVTLILAAQRPSGVTDQMRANIKCRICLRVEDTESSNELLSRPDAAYLPSIPGRGYVQIGSAGVLQQVQMAYTGEKYLANQEKSGRRIIWKSQEEGQPFHTALARSIKTLFDESLAHKEEGVTIIPRKPWPDPLPSQLALNLGLDEALEDSALRRDYSFYLKDEHGALDLMAYLQQVKDAADEHAQSSLGHYYQEGDPPPTVLNAVLGEWEAGTRHQWPAHQPGSDWWTRFAMKTVVGIIDDPANIRTKPLLIDFPKARHVILFGSSGWGKTTFTQSVIWALAATHSPAELHMYILDFGSQSLREFEELPHVGAYITRDETERVHRLFRVLEQMIAERKAAGVTQGLYEYNTNKKPFPAVLIVIDNFAEFHEFYWAGLESNFMTIIGQAASVGIHFWVTTAQTSLVTGRLLAQFGQRLALKLNNLDDYSVALSSRVKMVEDIPGRGLVQAGRHPASFQVATLFDTSNRNKTGATEKTFQRLREAMRDADLQDISVENDPMPINVLKTYIALSEVKQAQGVQELRTVLGTSDSTLQHEYISFAYRPHFLISGETQTGKTTALWTILLGLARTHDPERLKFILVDTHRRLFDYGGTYKLEYLPHILRTQEDTLRTQKKPLVYSEMEESERFMAELEALYASGGPPYELIVAVDNYMDFKEDFFDRKSQDAALSRLGKLARLHGQRGLHFILAGNPDALRGDKLSKQVGSSRYGIGLSVTAADNSPLNGKLSPAQKNADLPAGRGFLVDAGRVTMIQIATPGEPDKRIGESLDRYVKDICQQYGVDVTREMLKRKLATQDMPTVQPSLPATPSLEEQRWEERRRAIQELPDEAFLYAQQKLSDWQDSLLNTPLPDWAKQALKHKRLREMTAQQWAQLIATLESIFDKREVVKILGEQLGPIIYEDYAEHLPQAPEEPPRSPWEKAMARLQKLPRTELPYPTKYEKRLREYSEEAKSEEVAEKSKAVFERWQSGVYIQDFSIDEWKIILDVLRKNFTPRERYAILGRQLLKILGDVE